MEDQHLGRLLRELPQERARQGFTARVLARLDAEPKPARPLRWQPRLAAAATALTVALAAAGLVGYEHREAERAARVARAEQALRALRAEHGRLKKEVESLPETPVLYLGGDGKTDLVLDLRQVRSAQDGRSVIYQPAVAYTNETNDTF